MSTIGMLDVENCEIHGDYNFPVGGDWSCPLCATDKRIDELTDEILRRDEIWFLDKDEHGASHLVAVSDFKDVRLDKDIRKSYLQGRFGGVPPGAIIPRRARARGNG